MDVVDEKKLTGEAVAVAMPTGARGGPGWPAVLRGDIERLRRLGDLRGRAGEVHVLYPGRGASRRLILVGLGDADRTDLETLRRGVGRAVKQAAALKLKQLTVHLSSFLPRGVDSEAGAEAAAAAATLAAYRFPGFRREDPG